MNDNLLMLMFSTLAITISSIFSYFGLSNEIMGLYLFLLTADYVSGITKALVFKELSAIKMKAGLITKISMLFLPIVLAATMKIIGVEAQKTFEWGLGLLAVSECYSFIGNIYTIKTGKYLPKIDALVILGDRIRLLMQSKLSKWEEDNDDKRQNQNV